MRVPKGEKSIGWWVHCIHRHIMMLFDRELAPLGLTAGTFRFVVHLLREDGVTQEELAHKMYIDKGTTARALQKLESLSLVRRENDPADARAHRIYVTDKCRAMESEFEHVFHREQQVLTRGLAGDQKRDALHLLKTMGWNIIEELSPENGCERALSCKK